MTMKIGARVAVTDNKLPGTIRYVGTTQFAAGKWIGVELDEPRGKNDGSVQGKEYFSCKESHGMFVRDSQIFSLGDNPLQDSTDSIASSESASMTSSTGSKASGLKPPSKRPSKPADDEATGIKKPTSRMPAPSTAGMKASSSSGSIKPATSQTSLKTSPSNERLSKANSPSSEQLGSSDSLHKKSPAVGKEKSQGSSGGSSSGSSPKKTPGSSTSNLASPVKAVKSGSRGGSAAGSRDQSPARAGGSRKGSMTPAGAAGVAGAATSSPTQEVASPVAAAASPVGATPAGERKLSVAQKVAQIQQDVQRGRDREGIIRQSVGSYGIPEGMDPSTELEYLRVEVKDLSEKLETLRSRRHDDKQKLVDYEKVKIQIEQLLEYKGKMTEQHAQLQRELQQAQKDARETMESREDHGDEMTDLNEAVELATLDKEMAEEKCEMLQAEVDSLKEKIEELTLDLEIMKQEMEKGGEKVGDAYHLKQLEQQNERLKEAVVRMRDLSEHEKHETQRIAKELETYKTQYTDLVRKTEKLATENSQHETSMQDLKEQVDAALGAEEMVEQLTNRNLALEEKVGQLEESIADYEQMREMDAELQESQVEQEKEYQKEVDEAHGKINELRIKLDQAHGAMQDLELTIHKFRKHTTQLQEEIQDLKDRLAIAEHVGSDDEDSDGDLASGSNTAGGDAADALNMNVVMSPPVGTGMKQGSKTHRSTFAYQKQMAEIVDLESKKVELDNSQQYVRYLKAFLPDNFSKSGGDADAVLLSLLFPRLVAKCELLILQMKDKYPVPPGGMSRDHVTKSHKGDQWSFVRRLIYHLNSLIAVLHRNESIVSTCSVERLARLAAMQQEMAVQERNIDHYLDLLKANRLDENTSLEPLEKMINHFQNIYSIHLVSEEYDQGRYLRDVGQQFSSGLQWLSIDLKRSKLYLLPGNESSEIYKFFTDLDLFVSESESFVRKVKACALQKNENTVLKYDAEVLERLSETASSLERASMILNTCCGSASNQVTLIPDVEGIDANRMTDLLQDASERVCGRQADKSTEEIIKLCLGIVMANMGNLANSLEHGEYDSAAPEKADNGNFPPLLERAHIRKSEAVEADGLRWQLDKKDNEIMELKKLLRLKAEEVSEMQVRKDVAEKKLQLTGKEGDERMLRLQRKLEENAADVKRKEREYEQTIDTLQQDNDALERETQDLKERLKLLSKKALLQGISNQAGLPAMSPASPAPAPTVVGGGVGDSPYLMQEVEHLRAALQCVQNEKYYLQAERMKKTLDSLPPLNVPRKPTGIQSQTGLTDLNQATMKKHDETNVLLRETNKLQKDLINFTAQHRVIDISRRRPGHVPAIQKATPIYQLNQHLMEMKRLTEWSKDLHVRMVKQQGSVSNTGANVGGSKKKNATGHDILLARLTVPTKDSSVIGQTIPVTIGYDQFRALHEQLAGH